MKSIIVFIFFYQLLLTTLLLFFKFNHPTVINIEKFENFPEEFKKKIIILGCLWIISLFVIFFLIRFNLIFFILIDVVILFIIIQISKKSKKYNFFFFHNFLEKLMDNYVNMGFFLTTFINKFLIYFIFLILLSLFFLK